MAAHGVDWQVFRNLTGETQKQFLPVENVKPESKTSMCFSVTSRLTFEYQWKAVLTAKQGKQQV